MMLISNGKFKIVGLNVHNLWFLLLLSFTKTCCCNYFFRINFGMWRNQLWDKNVNVKYSFFNEQKIRLTHLKGHPKSRWATPVCEWAYDFLKIAIFCSSEYLFYALEHVIFLFHLRALQVFEKKEVPSALKVDFGK